MSFYDSQIKERKKYEEELLQDSYSSLEGSLTGSFQSTGRGDYASNLGNALDMLLDELHIHKIWQPKKELTFKQELEYLLKPYGMMYSFVDGSGDWYKKDHGPLIAELKGGGFVVLTKKKHYSYVDPKSRKTVLVDESTADRFTEKLIHCYVPLPREKLSTGGLMMLALKEMRSEETLKILLFSMIAVSCGTALPIIISRLMSDPQLLGFTDSVRLNGLEAYRPLVMGCVLMLFFIPFILFRYVFNTFKDRVLLKMANRISEKFQTSLMIRIYAMQPEEMAHFSTGDLGNHVIQTGVMARRLVMDSTAIVIDAVLALAYLLELGYSSDYFTRELILYILIAIVINSISAYVKSKVSLENMEYSVEAQSMTHNMIEGIRKIFLAGAQTRGFARWTDTYKKGIRSRYNPPVLTVVVNVLTTGVFALCLIDALRKAFRIGIGYQEFYVFFLTFGLLVSTLTDMFAHRQAVAMDLPHLKMIMPVMSAGQETTMNRVMVSRLRGNVSLRKVCYHYPGDDKLVLDNASFEIKAGENVAIVGKSGCGKSTVLRLLLGFAQPVRGDVLYDGQSLEGMDLNSVRSRLGVVLQDSTVIRGTIEDNIRLNAPDISEEELWETVRLAGLEEDILKLPLQMKTPLPFGGRGMSGGQIQKVLIARALASKPSILIFDEATSALDNISQKRITEALEKMDCTRIVVAHRLSTIRNADRILVLDNGHIVEEGDYDSLVKKGGLFAALVKRQEIESQTAATV